jgi:hypothetical protein
MWSGCHMEQVKIGIPLSHADRFAMERRIGQQGQR